MISKTYIKYIWLLNTLLQGEKSLKEVEMLWKNTPTNEGGLSPRTFHECRKGIKEMLGVDIECNRKKNVYYVKNPEVLNENRLTKWLLRKYSIPKDFATFNGMKDRVLLEEIPLGQTFLSSFLRLRASCFCWIKLIKCCFFLPALCCFLGRIHHKTFLFKENLM